MAETLQPLHFLDDCLIDIQLDTEVVDKIDLTSADKQLLVKMKSIGTVALMSMSIGGFVGFRLAPTALALVRSMMRSSSEPSPVALRYFRWGTMFIGASTAANLTTNSFATSHLNSLLESDGEMGIYARAKLQALYPNSDLAQRYRDRIQSDAENSELPALAFKKARERQTFRSRTQVLSQQQQQQQQPPSSSNDQSRQFSFSAAAPSSLPEERVIEDDFPRQSSDERRVTPSSFSPSSRRTSSSSSSAPSSFNRPRKDYSEDLGDRSDSDDYRPAKDLFRRSRTQQDDYDDDEAEYRNNDSEYDDDDDSKYRHRSSSPPPSAKQRGQVFPDRELRRRQRVQLEES